MNSDSKMCADAMREIYTNSLSSPPFSKRVYSFLSVLYERILHAHQSWTVSTKKWIDVPLHLTSSSDFIQPAEYNYVPSEIRASLVHEHKYQKQVQLKLRGHTYNILLCKPVQDLSIETKRKTTAFFDQALMKIYMWLYVIRKYSNQECSQTMSIYVYFTQHKKGLPSIDAESLMEIHVNTAFTTSCMPSTSVLIYREEEWFKVFIHETFHNLGLDFSAFDQTETNHRILDLYPIPSPPKGVRLYESYCETWAELFNALFVSFLNTRDKTNKTLILDKYEKMLKVESQYSAFQCVKILDYYGLTYQQLTHTTCEMSKKARSQYNERTHILAYYIMKAALISQPNVFIEWCLDYTQNGISFIKTQEHVNAFTQLVKYLYMNPILLHYVQDAEKCMQKKHKKSMVYTNLRMTVYG